MGSKEYVKLLSICIPSYNRGHRALKLVTDLLAMECISGRDDIEIIVSNNGSNLYTDEYEEIEALSGEKVIYNRFDENKQYYGNYNQIVRMSNGHYCLLISDEDSIDDSIMSEMLTLLEGRPNVGVIRTGTSYHYSGQEGGVYKAGEEALKRFYLTGNYISGSIYNRDYVTNDLINGLCELYEEDEGYFYYPHLFVECYVFNLADLVFFNKCLIIEGSEEGDVPSAEKVSVPIFASWESRTAQLKGYYKLIRDLNVDDGRKQLMFMMAVCKTISLISLVKEKYMVGGTWDEVRILAEKAILSSVESCDIQVIAENVDAYKTVIADFIKEDFG